MSHFQNILINLFKTKSKLIFVLVSFYFCSVSALGFNLPCQNTHDDKQELTNVVYVVNNASIRNSKNITNANIVYELNNQKNNLYKGRIFITTGEIFYYKKTDNTNQIIADEALNFIQNHKKHQIAIKQKTEINKKRDADNTKKIIKTQFYKKYPFKNPHSHGAFYADFGIIVSPNSLTNNKKNESHNNFSMAKASALFNDKLKTARKILQKNKKINVKHFVKYSFSLPPPLTIS